MVVLAASCTANSQPESSSLTPHSLSLHPTDDDQLLFEGDFFSTYGKDDIEWSGDDRSESGDEEDGPYDAAEWKPPIQDNHDELEPPVDEGDPTNDFGAEELDNQEAHQQIEQCIAGQDNIVIVPYLDAHAGKPITGRPTPSANATYGLNAGNTVNVYAPFASQMDWDIVKWAKLCGTSSTVFTDLLEIDGLSDCLGLSYKNSKELNKIIDKDLPGQPKFKREQIIVMGEAFDVSYRDIIKCIKALYSDPNFADFLIFAPKHHYTDEDHTWWDTQCLISDIQEPQSSLLLY
ncbi:hypothetical protein DFH29DRAFT_880249 [Suillus ampliporus]|nr:hypothetical protein DFH29DRAFT_880249 [Suillus ampliporus]